MFGFSYTEGGPWNDDGIKSIAKFMDRIERLVIKSTETEKSGVDAYGENEKQLDYAKNFAIKNIVKDMEAFSFNTSVARIMEYVNALQKYDTLEQKNGKFFAACISDLVKMIAPFAPHFAEELWEIIGEKDSVFEESFPLVDEKALVKDETEYAVQINSKIKAKIMVPQGLNNEEIQALVTSAAEITPALEGKTVKKCIVVPGRLVNLIIG